MSGQSRVLTVSLSGIRDAFALAGEPLSREYADIAFGTAFEPYRVDGVLDAEAVAIEKEQLRELLEGRSTKSAAIASGRRGAGFTAIPPPALSATVIWTRWTA